jgi:UrcA family protein
MRSTFTEEQIMSKRLVKLLPLAAALAASSLAHAGTVAEQAKDLPSVVVKYGDLNLGTRSGVASLHARLRSAAKQVCNELDSRVLGLRDQFAGCVSDAMTRSVARVHNPNLTRFHRYGRHTSDLDASS